jgi:hypothetical protein
MIYEPVSAHPKMGSKLSVKRVSKGCKMLKGCHSVAWQQSLVQPHLEPRLMNESAPNISAGPEVRIYYVLKGLLGR